MKNRCVVCDSTVVYEDMAICYSCDDILDYNIMYDEVILNYEFHNGVMTNNIYLELLSVRESY